MNGGKPCCILQICCPPGSPKQLDAFTEAFVEAGLSEADGRTAATFVLANFDLAPKGSLNQLKADIATMARASKAEP